jgi:hypothetical protein
LFGDYYKKIKKESKKTEDDFKKKLMEDFKNMSDIYDKIKGIVDDAVKPIENEIKNIGTEVNNLAKTPENIKNMSNEIIHNINFNDEIFKKPFENIRNKVTDAVKFYDCVCSIVDENTQGITKEQFKQFIKNLDVIFDIEKKLTELVVKNSLLQELIEDQKFSLSKAIDVLDNLEEEVFSLLLFPKYINIDEANIKINKTLTQISNICDDFKSAENTIKYDGEVIIDIALSEIKFLIKLIKKEYVESVISLIKKLGKTFPLPMNTYLGATAGAAVANGAAILGTKIVNIGEFISTIANTIMEFFDRALDFIDLVLDQIIILEKLGKLKV